MLVACPDCDQKVSERAKACPQCGFPIAEHMAEIAREAATQRERTTRTEVGEVDCVPCVATGFCTEEFRDEDGRQKSRFFWCEVCEHTGRVTLCRSERGYYAVARYAVAEFLAGTRNDDDEHVVFLGTETPGPHRYPAAGERHPKEPS